MRKVLLILGLQVNVSVKLQTDEQDATINPGDYLIGDLNGVVCLPKKLAEKAVALMAPQVAADEKIAADIQAGMTFTEASKKHRNALPKP
jgi:regulator of RNase E activity RraA